MAAAPDPRVPPPPRRPQHTSTASPPGRDCGANPPLASRRGFGDAPVPPGKLSAPPVLTGSGPGAPRPPPRDRGPGRVGRERPLGDRVWDRARGGLGPRAAPREADPPFLDVVALRVPPVGPGDPPPPGPSRRERASNLPVERARLSAL